MLALKLLAILAIAVILALLIWLLFAKQVPPTHQEPEEPVDPPIEPEDPEEPVDPPIDPPVEVDPSKFWYKIWLMAQGRPPDEWMKKSLNEEEYKYYIEHKAEFKPGSKVLYDAKGNKK